MECKLFALIKKDIHLSNKGNSCVLIAEDDHMYRHEELSSSKLIKIQGSGLSTLGCFTEITPPDTHILKRVYLRDMVLVDSVDSSIIYRDPDFHSSGLSQFYPSDLSEVYREVVSRLKNWRKSIASDTCRTKDSFRLLSVRNTMGFVINNTEDAIIITPFAKVALVRNFSKIQQPDVGVIEQWHETTMALDWKSPFKVLQEIEITDSLLISTLETISPDGLPVSGNLLNYSDKLVGLTVFKKNAAIPYLVFGSQYMRTLLTKENSSQRTSIEYMHFTKKCSVWFVRFVNCM